MGHSTQETVKKMFWLRVKRQEMFQPTELKSTVSGSKLRDWENVSMPAAHLRTLCTSAMPCFGAAAPVICRPAFSMSTCHLATPDRVTATAAVMTSFRKLYYTPRRKQPTHLSVFCIKKELQNPSPADSAETITQKWDVEAATKIYFKLALS